MINWKKYKYTGNIHDNWWWIWLTNCALCNSEIRYEFELQNENDENDILKIWCECVKKFDWTLSKQADKDKRTFLKDKSTERVLNSIIELTKQNSFFDDDFIRYFEKRNWFTPKQIIALHNGFSKYWIEIKYSDFKVKIKKNREKEKMNEFNYLDKQIISKFLTKAQKEKYNFN